MTAIELQYIAASFSLVIPDSLSLWHWTDPARWMDPEEDLVMLIKDHIARHPEDIPMLAPDKPAQWLRRNSSGT
jgi:hypothetical protein